MDRGVRRRRSDCPAHSSDRRRSKDGARPIAGRFTVPAGCPSQTIRLVGTTREYAPSEQVTINDLQLVRQAP